MCSLIRVSSSRGLTGIELSLRAFAAIRAERLFLQARAVIRSVLRAASRGDFVNFRLAGISVLSVERNVVLWLTTPKAAFRRHITSRSLVRVSLAVL